LGGEFAGLRGGMRYDVGSTISDRGEGIHLWERVNRSYNLKHGRYSICT
jgi:hypothetical protein